ncbi:MAG: hypothetical protein ABI430_04295 [Candidatus Taylorbacteria bacterium]
MNKDKVRILAVCVAIFALACTGIYLGYVTRPGADEIVSKIDALQLSIADESEKTPAQIVQALSPKDEQFIDKIINGSHRLNPNELYEFSNGVHYFKNGPCGPDSSSEETLKKCPTSSRYPDSNFAVTIDKKNIALGDVDTDGARDAGVILGERYGGTGYFVKLAIFRNDEENPIFVTAKDLGDRVKVESIEIKNGLIELHLLTHDSGEPLCCASTPKTVLYEFVEGTLLERE